MIKTMTSVIAPISQQTDRQQALNSVAHIPAIAGLGQFRVFHPVMQRLCLVTLQEHLSRIALFVSRTQQHSLRLRSTAKWPVAGQLV